MNKGRVNYIIEKWMDIYKIKNYDFIKIALFKVSKLERNLY